MNDIYEAKFYSVNLNLDKTEIKSELGIRIKHNEKEYSLSVSRNGDLILTALTYTQLNIKPVSANCAVIQSEA